MARGISPETNAGANLGSSTQKWHWLYVQNIDPEANLNGNYSLGYRQPSTTYSVGDVVYATGLSTTQKLVCTTAGTTADGSLTLSSTEEASETNDGTVTWAVDSFSSEYSNSASENANITWRNNRYRGAELPYTWSELKTKITNYNFTNLYVGDYIKITLSTNEVVYSEIAGISIYQRWNSIHRNIDFISRDCLAQVYQMNTTVTNNGTSTNQFPWTASTLYSTLNDESTGVFSLLPSDLQGAITAKVACLEKRYSSGGPVSADTGVDWTSAGKLWIPTETEVYENASFSELGAGTSGFLRYPIFRLSPYRILKGAGNGNSTTNWWLLSARSGRSDQFCVVDATGITTAANPTFTYGVPLCFRISI